MRGESLQPAIENYAANSFDVLVFACKKLDVRPAKLNDENAPGQVSLTWIAAKIGSKSKPFAKTVSTIDIDIYISMVSTAADKHLDLLE